MNNLTMYEKYLKEKDELLLEVYATGKISKFRVLLDIISVFVFGDTSAEYKEKHYILGFSKSNIHIVYLGKYYRHDHIPENVVPEKVETIKIKSISEVSISSVLDNTSQRVKFKEQKNTHTYYIGEKFIDFEQLKCLKKLIIAKL